MDTSQIFENGIDAYGADTPRDDCPYPAGSDEREFWLGGWDEAKNIFDEEETSDNIRCRPALKAGKPQNAA